MKTWAWVLVLAMVLALCASSAQAAVIIGKIYDLSLLAVPRAVVMINSTPLQRDVVENGQYRFIVGPGSYHITAEDVRSARVEGRAVEDITIEKEGNYTLDLILGAVIDEDLDSGNETLIPDVPVDDSDSEVSLTWLAWTIAIAGIVEVGYLLWKRRQPKEPAHPESKHHGTSAHGESLETPEFDPQADIDKALAFVKSAGGRTTQKELRKAFPYSEAKVSLILTEMEHKGLVEKIKKGRGNVVISK